MSTLIPVPNKRRQNHLAALRRTSVNSQNGSSSAITSPISYNFNSNSRASSPALSQRSSISYSSSTNVNSNNNINKNNSDFCQVTVRIRPFTANEWNLGNTIPVWEGNEELSTVSYSNEWLEKSNKNQLSYQYDNVIVGSDNKELYNRCVKDVVMSSMEGLNGTVFAYGQTASGKTYSMLGVENQPGIIPQAVDDVFYYIKEMSKGDREFLLRVSYMEIYNEQIQDLLSPETTNLRIFEDRRRGIYVSPLKEEIVTSAKQVMRIIQKGETNRHISTTDYNKHSSRSHTIFQMIIESKSQSSSVRSSKGSFYSQKSSSDSVKISQLNLIDLSGSEKATSDADRRKEGAFINKSLLTLGNVISKLTEEKRGHIPYRDSKLTRILQSSLSGNAKISVICTISPAGINADESHNTLNFAKRVKKVATKAHTNQVLDDKALIQKYKKEINELKVKLQVATDMSNISNVASLEDGKKDEELMLLQQERIKWEEEMHEQQLLRTALKERIDHLTKLILTSSSISPQMMLEFSRTPTKTSDGNKVSLLSPLNISENELPPYIEEALTKQNGQLEKLQKEAKAKDEYIKELELMLQEGKYLDMLTPDANEISMNEQTKDELAAKIKENKSLAIEIENNQKIIEELTNKNKDLELLITQQDAKLSSYSTKEHAIYSNLNNTNISPEVESLLEDQQHSLELLEEENKQLRKALNQSEFKLKKLELVQFEDIEKLVIKACGNNANTNIPSSSKNPPLNLNVSSTNSSNTSSSNGGLGKSTKNEINVQNPTSPTKRHQSSTIYNNNNNNKHNNSNPLNNESINNMDKENYYTMIIQELQASLEEERKRHQKEMEIAKEQMNLLQDRDNQS
ncbi:kinesin-domain-containing protein [Neocallimastix californiae]|uniref:Kinesin-domain-containing protein n=1 Tax=Neocallimastix californiae TaxID=1754190 RepID=A0A1Y2ANV3_9FUNG|nr:kinesin-domain-containing protein [Neocallimastix californiae]|eukprot:ORY23970.1 kinesin-domain-containing protein [Neocallimastix californiae]